MAGRAGSEAGAQEYPGTWAEFLAWFPDEAACARYLERLRWPEGVVCRACGGRRGWRTGAGRWWVCAGCSLKTSVTAGTIFDKTRTPVQTWFAAAWFVTSQKHGLSALGLQRALGLGSYQTAWMILHRLRAAMVRPGRERLRARSRSTRPTSAARKPVSEADRRRRSRSWRSLLDFLVNQAIRRGDRVCAPNAQTRTLDRVPSGSRVRLDTCVWRIAGGGAS
jgi:hypothetical protein